MTDDVKLMQMRVDALDAALKTELQRLFGRLFFEVFQEAGGYVAPPKPGSDARSRCERGICTAFLVYQEQVDKLR